MTGDIERGRQRAAGGNRYAFAALVRRRVQQLDHGAQPRAVVASQKPVSVAIAEAARGRIRAKG